ncbi:RagB/SusD family nutrient uptake outer membrane protein [Draconibacterium sp.]|nr:RagB/SusD family nutrient uptake outer membrane protein [Draconibacterium sp.]
MKKLKYIICFSILLGFSSACTDFLEEDNKGGIDNETFYATSIGYETLLTASYAHLRDLWGRTPVQDLIGTDLYMEHYDGGDRKEWSRYESLYPTEPYLNDWYETVYNAIQTTNAGIFYNDLPETLDDRAAKLGELKFLRAYYHFVLMEQLGGVVINDEYTNSPRLEIPRSSLAESYEFVISEMEAALAAVPASSEPGRVNKNVVNHFLSRVYLTRGWDLDSDADFNQAKSHADAVISSLGPIKLPYKGLWDEAGENNEEFIFAVQYSLSSVLNPINGGNQQSAHYQSYGGSAGNDQKRRNGSMNVASFIHQDFQLNDARYFTCIDTITHHPYFSMYTDNPGPILYYNPIITDPNKTDFTAQDSAQWADALIAQGYTLSDVFEISPVWKNNYDRYTFAQWERETAPIFIKFDCPENGENCYQDYVASVRDVVIARLAETYFLKAEACIALDQISEARDLVQVVLDRPGNKIDAAGEDLTNALDGVSGQTEALEALLIESGKEFLGEYNGRWAALRRTKMLKHMLEKYNADFDRNNITWQDKWSYRPIPEDAITLNNGLTEADQNPGY